MPNEEAISRQLWDKRNDNGDWERYQAAFAPSKLRITKEERDIAVALCCGTKRDDAPHFSDGEDEDIWYFKETLNKEGQVPDKYKGALARMLFLKRQFIDKETGYDGALNVDNSC